MMRIMCNISGSMAVCIQNFVFRVMNMVLSVDTEGSECCLTWVIRSLLLKILLFVALKNYLLLTEEVTRENRLLLQPQDCLLLAPFPNKRCVVRSQIKHLCVLDEIKKSEWLAPAIRIKWVDNETINYILCM